jgi:hypothetical protein
MALMVCFAKAPERLHLPAFSFLACLALYQSLPPARDSWLKDKRFFQGRLGWILLGLLGVLTIPHLNRYFAVDAHFREREALLTQSVEKLNPQDDQLYVVWNSQFPYEKISACDSFEMFRNFHYAEPL